MSDPYELPSEDVEYLDANFPSKWKKVTEGTGKHGLIVEDFTIPLGYTVSKSNLLVLIPVGYPGSALDMFYFLPHLHKSDETAIECLVAEVHFDENWQRWSRHYDWEAGVDSLAKHIQRVETNLSREVET